MGMLITMGNVNDLKWLWGEVYEVTVGDTDGNGKNNHQDTWEEALTNSNRIFNPVYPLLN